MTPADAQVPAPQTSEPATAPAGAWTAPARLTGKPTWLISQISTHAHRLLTERLGTAGARGYHYRLLAALQEFGPASQASLGRRTAMDRSDVAAALNDLADGRYVQRTQDPADHRRNVITITPAGTAHLRRLDGLLAEVQDDLLAPLSASERGQLTGLLSRVLDHHGRLPYWQTSCVTGRGRHGPNRAPGVRAEAPDVHLRVQPQERRARHDGRVLRPGRR